MHPKVKESTIPNFRLYGTAETAGANLFFNIAPIPVVGEQANYKHAPHRHAHLHQMVWLSAGYTEITIDETPHPLGAGTLYLIPAGVVHGSTFSRQLDGFVVHFSPDFLLSGAGLTGGAAGLPGGGFLAVHFTGAAGRIQGLLASIEAEFQQASPEKNELIRHYLHIVLLEMQREAGLVRAGRHDQASSIFPARFVALVEQHYATKKQVSDYAELLHITPDYLNELVKRTTGRTAGQLIRDRVILEAKRRFLFSEETVSEVAHALNYDDVSYFWRLFKKYVNLSPTEFKKLGYRQ